MGDVWQYTLSIDIPFPLCTDRSEEANLLKLPEKSWNLNQHMHSYGQSYYFTWNKKVNLYKKKKQVNTRIYYIKR